MGSHVFICYAREDADFVLSLAENLRARDIPVWLDQWDILPGEDWDKAIETAIRGCSRFLIVLSPAAVASHEVEGEWRLAQRLRKFIVPVLYEECDVPRQLWKYQFSDFTQSGPGDEALLDELVSGWRGAERPAPLPSDRHRFLELVSDLPDDARVFENEFSKTVAVALAEELSNDQFRALHDLRLYRDRYDRHAGGIRRSEALEAIGEPVWKARSKLAALEQFGFLEPSRDDRDRPGLWYDYTFFFWCFTNLMGFLQVGELESDGSPPGSEYWLSSRDG